MNSRKTFTLIELLVVIAILAILASLLLPSLMRAKYYARNTLCVSNIRQMLIGLTSYTGDYDDYYPHRGRSARVIGNPLTWPMFSDNGRYEPPNWDYRAFYREYFTPELNSFMKCPMAPTNFLSIETDEDADAMPDYRAKRMNLNYFGDPPDREVQSSSYAMWFDATPATGETHDTATHWDQKMAMAGQTWQTRSGLPGRALVSELLEYHFGRVVFSKRGLIGYDPAASNNHDWAFNLFNASYPVNIWALFNVGHDDGSVIVMPVRYNDINGTTGNLLSVTGDPNRRAALLPADSYE